MLRRFSTFRKARRDEGAVKANGANGINGANGVNGSYTPDKALINGSSHAKKEKTENEHSSTEGQGLLEQFAQLIHMSRRPLPTQSGDGAYLDHEVPSGLMDDLRSLGFKDVKTLMQVMTQKKGTLQDDKTYLMERLVSSLPPKSKTRVDLTNSFIDELWNSLQHPPQSYLGDKYQYRQADGSYNNMMFPQLGAANTPYARSVFPGTLQPGSLPDPALIFDSLFARNKGFRPHPNNVSSMLFYWASLIIHDLFQTDHRDFSMSQTSSYLDLSPLYGDNQEDQDQIRTFKDGMLKPDCFSEPRILGMPPACGIILIMFNRFHNYVAEQLAVINERGRFNKPKDGLSEEASKKAWQKYDHDLFNTARLVTCGLYMNITLLDYLRTIVNLNRSNTTWTLDPRVEMGKEVMGEASAPRGMGNQVSCEFNLVYRWHAAISAKDEKWTESLYRELFGKEAHEVSLPELLQGLGRWEKSMDKDPHKRPFAHLKRGPDGKLDDNDLVSILTEAVEDTAGAFGANNVPVALKAVEILGMQQARNWNCGSLNEFRKFFGLKPHSTFEEINSDPLVADQLRHLYEHPDFVEMYPGIVAEEAKVPMVPGVGICPTYTISRAILSDAVTLVRSDRFYTIDYHPKNLTNWGYSEVQYDLNVEQGCVFYKLFLRAFPNHFKPDSIYAHYPMTIPSENRKIMKSLGREQHYSWDRPALIPARINLTSYIGAKFMLERKEQFNVTWGAATEFVMAPGGKDFMLSGDTNFHSKQRQLMSKALYREDWHKEIKEFYEHITLRLLHENACKIAGINQVDITRDVGNIAHVHFASNVFSLPLKTKEHPRGIFSEHEMYGVLAIIFVCIFFDLDPAKSFPLRLAAKAFGQSLGKLIEANVKATNMTGWIAGMVDGYSQNQNALTDYGVHMIRRLLDSGLDAKEIAWSQVLPTAAAMVPNQAQVFTQLLDYYLSEEGKSYLPDIRRLALEDTPDADEKLLHYCMEGIRLNGTFGSYRESTISTTIDDGGRAVDVKPGDKIFCSFVGANRDPVVFPSPNEVRIDRPLESYIHYGVGPHRCLGEDASRVALTAMLKVVGRLENLRRAPGPQGQMKKIPRAGGFYIYMTENHGSYFPFPTTMKVNWDGELPPLKK
ncbi:hypothetical protein MMC11_001272 [Xylographa trunciseda]|nr:hypothetical protein [Xylographa trunciseda]